MKSLNNKGQTLVLFIMLLPIMLLVMVLVFDIGKCLLEKQKLNSISSMAVSYGIEHSDDDDIENKINELIILNCKDVSSIVIDVNDNYVSVDLSEGVKGIFGNIVDKSNFKVRSYYVGNINDKKIEKIK